MIDNPFKIKIPVLKASVVCAGPIKCLKLIQKLALKDGYQTIAVDGGFDTVQKTGLRPVFSIGDFDSTDFDEEEIRYGSEDIITLQANKDKTDFEEALEEAFYRGFTEISVFGILGGKRFDFELNNLLVLSKYASLDRKIRVFSEDGDFEFVLLTEGQNLKVDDVDNINLSKPVSIIPIKPMDVKITDFEYEFDGILDPFSSHGMSNIAKRGGIVEVRSGTGFVGINLIQ